MKWDHLFALGRSITNKYVVDLLEIETALSEIETALLEIELWSSAVSISSRSVSISGRAIRIPSGRYNACFHISLLPVSISGQRMQAGWSRFPADRKIVILALSAAPKLTGNSNKVPKPCLGRPFLWADTHKTTSKLSRELSFHDDNLNF